MGFGWSVLLYLMKTPLCSNRRSRCLVFPKWVLTHYFSTAPENNQYRLTGATSRLVFPEWVFTHYLSTAPENNQYRLTGATSRQGIPWMVFNWLVRYCSWKHHSRTIDATSSLRMCIRACECVYTCVCVCVYVRVRVHRLRCVLERTLFIITKHKMRILGVSPLFKLQSNTLTTVERWKMRCRIFICCRLRCFVTLVWCPMLRKIIIMKILVLS